MPASFIALHMTTPAKSAFTKKKPNTGIMVPSNNQAGAQKLAAICAIDLARKKHSVHIFIPRLPYYFYFVTLGGDFYRWLKIVRHYFFSYLRDRRFCFHDLIQASSVHPNIHIHNVFRRPGKRITSNLDCLIVMTIAQVAEMQSVFNPEKTIYQIHHPEERVYAYPEVIRNLRRSFTGKIIAISPWTAGQITDHLPEPPVVPDVISNTFWEYVGSKNIQLREKDILFHFSLAGHKGKETGKKLISLICGLRPGTQFTIWSRDGVPKGLNGPVVRNIPEKELGGLYRNHKMLLFPSNFEGFGMPPIEALACGCIPILYSGIGAADLYARDGETAVIIDADLETTAKRVARLLDDHEKMEAMRRSAQKVLSPFNPEGYGLRLLTAAGFDFGSEPNREERGGVADG